MKIETGNITIPKERRRLRNLDELAGSMNRIGLLNPITLTEELRLIAGYHRLEAAKLLGWTEIEATVLSMTALEAEMAEIDENLIRNELTALERAEETARRKKLYLAMYPETKQGGAPGAEESGKGGKLSTGKTAESAVLPVDKYVDNYGSRPSFVESTAEKTGRSERTVFKDVQIGTDIIPEVRDAIRDTQIADRKTELLKLARMEPEEQRKVAEIISSSGNREKTITQVKREIRAAEIQRQVSLPDAKFRVVYADPPWSYGNNLSEGSTEPRDHYPVMSLDDICALSVRDICEENSVLFLWVTSPILEDAFKVINAWGFSYKTSFVWDKIKHNMGHYNSVRHEFLLIATRGSGIPDNPKLFDSVVSIERGGHSEKPDIFYEIIETLYPVGKKIELFQRKSREGWEGFGYEADA